MKIALCLHGIVGTDDKYGEGGKMINYKIGLRHFKQHVFDVNDKVDVFFHTWSTDYEQKLIEAYSPVAYEVEKQPLFSEDPRKQAIYCRWLSTKKAINLVNNSANDYDFVLLTRFDIAFMVDFDFSKFNTSKFYAQGPPGAPTNGLDMINDLWFFANQENITKFATLYDKLGAEKYEPHIDSNHELARRHLIETGLHDNLEYMLGYDVEVDVWYMHNKLYLGHNLPQYDISIDYLKNEHLWCHCKNVNALKHLLDNGVHCFFHKGDDVTLTSRGVIWTFPQKQLVENSVCVMPEYGYKGNLDKCMGVCSDYIQDYKK